MNRPRWRGCWWRSFSGPIPNVTLTYAILTRKPGDGSAANFKFCWGAPTTPWTWTFGNDDVLLPGGLRAVMDLITQAEQDGVGFIKVAEKGRASETHGLDAGTFIELAERWGLIELSGFITGNVFRTDLLKKAVALDSWKPYEKCSFGHCVAFLEAFGNEPALFVDVPLVEPQDSDPTPETIRQWEEQSTAKRFFYFDECLRSMKERDLLDLPLPITFFRYHSYYLWDRLIGNMITQYSHHPEDAMPELWDDIWGLTEFLDEGNKETLQKRIGLVKDSISDHRLILNDLAKASHTLNVLLDQHNTEVFPFRYTGEARPLAPFERSPIGLDGLTNVAWAAQLRQRRDDMAFLNQQFPEAWKAMAQRKLADFPNEEPRG